MNRFRAARLDAQGKPVDPRVCGDSQPPRPQWYVTSPRTGATHRVAGDAENTARQVAWSQWYGTPIGDSDEPEYAALEVVPAETRPRP